MKPIYFLFHALILALALLNGRAFSAQPMPGSAVPAMETPVDAGNLDPAAFAEWVDGAEKSLAGGGKDQTSENLLWTRKTQMGTRGQVFGDSKTPGARHLRIGFMKEIPIGSVLVNGGGQLSVLKPSAAYPGALNRDEDWIPADRLEKGEASRVDVAQHTFALWILPPGTQTRALRFTHVAKPEDAKYAGNLDGVFIVAERWSNLAPQAIASASANDQKANLFNNNQPDTFKTWDNLDRREDAPAGEPVVTPNNAPWVMLAWPAPVKIGALDALGAGFAEADVQSYEGPAERHPRDAAEGDWKSVRHFSGLKKGYPRPLWPNRLIFEQAVTTRAIRLKITAPTDEAGPHNKGDTKEGKRVWLGELMALQLLGDAPLQAVRFAALELPHPPIPVRFKLEQAGSPPAEAMFFNIAIFLLIFCLEGFSPLRQVPCGRT